MKRRLVAFLTLIVLMFACVSIIACDKHVHSFSTEWMKTNTHHYHVCSCGEKIDNEEHQYDLGSVTKEPTATETGVKTFTCLTCSKTKTEEIPVQDTTPDESTNPSTPHVHSFSTEWMKTNTHHYHVCSCGEKIDNERHQYDLGSVTKEPTATETGIKTFTCLTCSKTKTEEISAQGTPGLKYQRIEGKDEYAVAGIGTASEIDIEIPSTYNNLPVTQILESAFYQNNNITSIKIPDSVLSIGNDAFYNCSSLESITVGQNNIAYKSMDGNLYSKDGKTLVIYATAKTSTTFEIPDSVEIIEDYAFSNCDLLKSVTIGNNVESIGKEAFYNCSSLESITIPDSVKSIGNLAFELCESLKYNVKDNVNYLGNDDNKYIVAVSMVDKTATSLTIDNNCKVIGDSAFSNCDSLESIVIPDSIKSICNAAFSNCDLLKSVTLGNSVEIIGDRVFHGCSLLKSVTLGNRVESIGGYAFAGCALESITIPDSVKSIGYSAFSGCALESVVVPDSVKSIGSQAFSYCSSLKSVIIGNNVESIGWWVFSNCSSLESVTIPDSVKSIGYRAFESCESLKYNVKDNVNYLGNDDNKYLVAVSMVDKTATSLTIDNNCKVICECAFYSCDSLKSVTLGNSVEIIEDSAFSYCSSLKSITLGNSVESIGIHAFSYCSSLESITIPDSVKSIGDYAFSHCASLESVVIPDSVKSIGCYAFESCESLKYNVKDNVNYLGNDDNKYLVAVSMVDETATSLTIDNNCKVICECAFQGRSSLKSVTLGNSVESIGDYAFSRCSSLESVTIPDSVESIGKEAFYGCTLLTDIYCSAESQPSGWDDAWNSSNATVHWGYTGE